MDDKADGFLGYFFFDLETSWRAHCEILSLNLYRVGAPDGSPVLNGKEWGKISYARRENHDPDVFSFKSLAGHYFGNPSIQCIDPFVLPLIREYANHCFIDKKVGEFFQYQVKKYRSMVMAGTLFAPDWTHDPKVISLEKIDDNIPF